MMSLNISNNNCPISNKRKWQIILGGKQGYTGWWQHLEARANVASKQLRRGQWCLSMNAAWSTFLFFPFSCVHLQRSVRLKMIIARCGFETGGETGMSNWGLNWGMNKWPTRIFPHGLTVWTDGPQVTGSPFQQSGAICMRRQWSKTPERWWGGERGVR